MKNYLTKPTNLPDFSDLDISFDIIDSHHHLFNLDKIYYPWLTDNPEPNFLLGDYDAIKKHYTVNDYRADIGKLSVVKTIHVEAEADHDSPVSETRWLVKTMEKQNFPNAIVAHAWLNQPKTEKILETQSAFNAVRGIRSKPVTSLSAAKRGKVRGKPCSMQDENWRAGLGLLRKYNLSWDLRVPFWHLAEAAEVCGLYGDLPVVVEHTGLPWNRDDGGLSEWRKGLAKLASREHVFLKISELGLTATPWDYKDNARIVRVAIELFGFKRCMFGSNFPVAGLRISYLDQVRAIAHMIQDCSLAERHALFHDTANTFYRLNT